MAEQRGVERHRGILEVQLVRAAETTPGSTGRREREESVVILGFPLEFFFFFPSVLVLPRS